MQTQQTRPENSARERERSEVNAILLVVFYNFFNAVVWL